MLSLSTGTNTSRVYPVVVGNGWQANWKCCGNNQILSWRETMDMRAKNLEVERRIPEGGWLYRVFEADWIHSRKGKVVEGKWSKGGREGMVRWWKGPSERTVKPPFEADWLVDEFERSPRLSLFFLAEERTKGTRRGRRKDRRVPARGLSTNTEMVKVY